MCQISHFVGLQQIQQEHSGQGHGNCKFCQESRKIIIYKVSVRVDKMILGFLERLTINHPSLNYKPLLDMIQYQSSHKELRNHLYISYHKIFRYPLWKNVNITWKSFVNCYEFRMILYLISIPAIENRWWIKYFIARVKFIDTIISGSCWVMDELLLHFANI